VSLINDTLRELDRRKAQASRPSGSPSAPFRRRTRRVPFALAMLIGIGAAWIGLGAAWRGFGSDDGSLRAWARGFRATRLAAVPDEVADWVTADVASAPPASAKPAVARLAAPAELRALLVEGDREHVRVELEVRGELPSEPRPVLTGGQLRLELDGVRIGAALDPLAIPLAPAPWLQSLDLVERRDRLVVRMVLDGEILFRSRLVRRAEHSRIVLELSQPGEPRLASTRSAAPKALALPAVSARAELPAIPQLPLARGPGPSPPPAEGSASAGDAGPARMQKTQREPTAAERAADRHREARRLLRDGATEEALSLLEAALEDDPRHAEARATLATILIATGRRDEALARLEQAQAEGSASSRGSWLLAGLLADEGRSGEALARLGQVEPGAVPEIDHQGLRAALLQDLGQHAEAVELWRSVLRIDPRRAEAWMGMAISLEAISDAGGAYTAYRAALRVGGLAPEPATWVASRVEALAP
jgi:tetratricopeptide (TPR) repeat protein